MSFKYFRRNLVDKLRKDNSVVSQFRIYVLRILFRVGDLLLKYFPMEICREYMIKLYSYEKDLIYSENFLIQLQKFGKFLISLQKDLLHNLEQKNKTKFFKYYKEVIFNLNNLMYAYEKRDITLYKESNTNKKYDRYNMEVKEISDYDDDDDDDYGQINTGISDYVDDDDYGQINTGISDYEKINTEISTIEEESNEVNLTKKIKKPKKPKKPKLIENDSSFPNRDRISKHFKIDKKHLLFIRPQTRDGLYKYVDMRNGHIYTYDQLEHTYHYDYICNRK